MRNIRSHIVCLTLCLLGSLAGAAAVVGAVAANGAEHGRLTQCLAGERMDLVVLPAGFPGDGQAPTLPPEVAERVAAQPGIQHVRQVLGGTVHAGARPLQAVAFPADGLPMLPLVSGRLPSKPTEAVLDRSTAASLGLEVGDALPTTGQRGNVSIFHISGLVTIDMDERYIARGAIGLQPGSTADLLGSAALNGLQVTVTDDAQPTEIRARITRALGPGPSVFTRQDIAARRTPDAQIVTVGLAVLGLTVLLFAAAVSTTTYGRLRETWRRSPKRTIAEHGVGPLRRLMTFDRLIGLPIALVSGLAIGAGLLVVLAGIGADLPCTGVYSIMSIAVLIPLATFVAAMALAPIPARLQKVLRRRQAARRSRA